MSIVRNIRNWAEIFNMPISDKLTYPSINSQNMIEEESGELKTALSNLNNYKCKIGVDIKTLLENNPDLITDIVDGAIDTIWVCVRLLQDMGIDVYKSFDSVYESNMSKSVLLNEIELKKELEHLYNEAKNKREEYFVVVEEVRTNVDIENKEDRQRYIFRREDTGKILKPSTFKQPDFSWIK